MARILVIEDEPSIAMALRQTLLYAGHDVLSASDGQAALHLLQTEQPPDVILVDLFMPVMNGRAFLTAMRAQASFGGIPVVLITGAVPDKQDFPPEGSYQAFISKPFSVTTVLSTVARLLAPNPS